MVIMMMLVMVMTTMIMMTVWLSCARDDGGGVDVFVCCLLSPHLEGGCVPGGRPRLEGC